MASRERSSAKRVVVPSSRSITPVNPAWSTPRKYRKVLSWRKG